MSPETRPIQELVRIGEAELERRRKIGDAHRGRPRTEAERDAISRGMRAASIRRRDAATRNAVSGVA